MMVHHKFEYVVEVTFSDGSKRNLEIPEQVYYYAEQKRKYWAIWLDELITKYDITAKPIELCERFVIVECEPYRVIVGV